MSKPKSRLGRSTFEQSTLPFRHVKHSYSFVLTHHSPQPFFPAWFQNSGLYLSIPGSGSSRTSVFIASFHCQKCGILSWDTDLSAEIPNQDIREPQDIGKHAQVYSKTARNMTDCSQGAQTSTSLVGVQKPSKLHKTKRPNQSKCRPTNA